ncbi:hypothetical protein ACPPVQ_05980 [Diaminobutyricibacter sp. McL0618]|uniref:hypothetical protein n=1 Tax=Leifsonia sp. McL0618 TaxID=3415677 RepID=UPI003CEC95EE
MLTAASDPWSNFGPDVLAGILTGITTGIVVGLILWRLQVRAERVRRQREILFAGDRILPDVIRAMKSSRDFSLDHPYQTPPRYDALEAATGAHPVALWAKDNPIPELVATAQALKAGERLRLALDSLEGAIRPAIKRVADTVPSPLLSPFIWTAVLGRAEERREWVATNGLAFDLFEYATSRVFEGSDVAPRLRSFFAEKAAYEQAHLELGNQIITHVFAEKDLPSQPV